MKDFFAKRVHSIQPSPILAINSKAKALQAEGKTIYNFSSGELDFNTPEFIQNAAMDAMRQGLTKYTDVSGMRALREAIVEKLSTENGLDYAVDEISVGVGGKHVLFNAFMATLNPGDEVIIPAPYWTSYLDMVWLAEGKTVIVECLPEHGFKLTPDALERAITPQTKWLLLNSPSNPTGACYQVDELRALADVLLRYPHVWILSDDIYEYFVYDAPFVNLLQVEPLLRNRFVLVNGVSKAYSMTGWRLGYGAGPRSMIQVMSAVQSQSTTHTSSITQAASIVAIRSPKDFLVEWKDTMLKRRNLALGIIRSTPGLTCHTAQGAFYLFVDCSGIIGKTTPSGQVLVDDTAVVEYFLDSCGAALVMGSVFGMSPYFRLSYATSEHVIEEGLTRLRESCEVLREGE